MLCQNCKERQATVRFTKVINGVKTDMHLCEKCAPLMKHEFPAIKSFDITVSDIINSFFGGSSVFSTTTCDSCGASFDDFSKTGKFGCPECYNAFSSQLASPLKRIHGNDRHIGKIPKRAGDGVSKITQLKNRLAEAIAKEDFENAATIRDEIRRLEGGKEQ